uniref:Nucleotide-diphospho-sugar transferase domain-containing protein n=1 Tax=Manihot esculenta TaxID=3983 RepID=A0A2C9WRY9_MANES
MRSCGGWRRFLLYFPLLLIIFHIFSCGFFEFRPNSVMEAGAKKRNKKSDHLVLGPAAGRALPNRLQCQGFKALNKSHLLTSSSAYNGGDRIAFVTVFTIYNASLYSHADSKSSNLVTVGNVSYTKTERSMAILNVFINFIQTFLNTRLKELAQNPGRITHYIFTDSDIAVVDDLEHIFQKFTKFHVALTFRNNKEQPLNSGFIAVRGTPESILRAKTFLQEVLEVYTSKYMKASRMLGDQLALAWVIKSQPNFDVRRFKKVQAFVEEIGGASVLFLPCAIYNWTPPEGAGQFRGMPLDVKVVHFKGSRKRLMLESWDFFSSASDIYDMLCLILMSGRTKYDF